MINPEELNSILKSLGKNPIKKIQNYLKNHNITNHNNEAFSEVFIQQILNGEKENIALENAIFTVSYQHLMTNTKKQGSLQILLDNQKSEFD